ncbi:MAG: type II toxin-antitoxin system HipA family toxin [Tannerella sp.]|jgi:serine/threonine-protein kinase HipA|nr:type II toxin-antitoxin system HipA family toxin [Tannerella sp.]
MIAEVKLWGEPVGTLSLNPDGITTVFRFDADFLKKGLDIAPIQLPLKSLHANDLFSFNPNDETEFQTYKALPDFIADSLPDSFGNRVIEAWLIRQRRDISSFSAVERLCYTGKRGLGALEYHPLIPVNDKIVDVDVHELVKLANDVLQDRRNLNTNFSRGDEALMDIVRVGSSAGGARPKAVIAYNETTGEVKSGQIPDVPNRFAHWLIKFDGVSNSEPLGLSTGMGRVEYAYHLMAKDCKIDMAECRLMEEGGRAHFMTRRFDRPGGGETLHMQTLNAIAHLSYKLIDRNYYEQLFTTLRDLRMPHTTFEQQYRRMVFNVVAKNCDDHTKNVSFLMDKKGNWSLSPAYDVSYAYNPLSFWNKRHLMGINGKFDNFTRKDLEKIGIEEGIKNRNEIIEQVCEVVSRWPEYAKSTGVDKSIYERIGSVHETHINMKENATIVKPSNKLKNATQDLKKDSPKQSPGRKMKL